MVKKVDEKLLKWQGRISTMKSYMNQASERKQWKNLKDYYRGDYKKVLKLSMPIVVVNMVLSFVKTDVASLFARNPKFKCNANNGRDVVAAMIAEASLNYYWYTKKVKRQVKKCLKEAKLLGYSWIKVGYNAEVGVEEDGVNEYIKKDDIFATMLSNDAVWYDTEALDPPHDCRWMIHQYLMATDKASEKFGVKVNSTDELDYTYNKKKKKSENFLVPEDRNMTRIYEIWDKENEELIYYSDGYKEGFLEEKKWPYEFNGFPFEMLTFDTMTEMDDYDNLPTSEVLGFIDQIFEKIKIRSLEMNHIKRHSRQLAYDKNLLDPSDLAHFKLGVDGGLIPTDGSPANVIQPINYAAMQPEIYQVENRIDNDLQVISGQSALRSGGQVKTNTRTLGEIQEIAEGDRNRLIEQQDVIEEFTEGIAIKLIGLMRQFYDGERYARIIGDVSSIEKAAFEEKGILDGISVKYSKEDIQGEYDIEVVAGSTLPLDASSRLNRLTSIARFGSAFGLTPNSITSMYLGKAIMSEMELKDVERAYDIDVKRALAPKQPSPQEQMQIIDGKTKIDNRVADTELKKTRIEGNQMSNVSKGAKAADDLEGNNDVV